MPHAASRLPAVAGWHAFARPRRRICSHLHPPAMPIERLPDPLSPPPLPLSPPLSLALSVCSFAYCNHSIVAARNPNSNTRIQHSCSPLAAPCSHPPHRPHLPPAPAALVTVLARKQPAPLQVLRSPPCHKSFSSSSSSSAAAAACEGSSGHGGPVPHGDVWRGHAAVHAAALQHAAARVGNPPPRVSFAGSLSLSVFLFLLLSFCFQRRMLR